MKVPALLLLAFFLSVNSVLAISPTPESTPSSSTPSLDEIQKIRQAVQEKVKEKLKQIDNSDTIDTATPKSLAGTVSQIKNNQIIISYNNTAKTISTDTTTVFIDTKRNKTKMDQIKVGQDILAMGYFNSDSSLNAKRIVITDLKSLTNNNQVVIGQVVDVSKSSPVFVLIPSGNKNSQYQIKTDSKTQYNDKNNKALNVKNLSSGQKVITIIKPDTSVSNTFYAIKIIPLTAVSTPTSSPTPTKK